jgi:hypothetical protein
MVRPEDGEERANPTQFMALLDIRFAGKDATPG